MQRFGWGARPAAETVKPTLTWSASASLPLTFTGTAADASKVMMVELQIMDPATGTYWNTRTWIVGRGGLEPGDRLGSAVRAELAIHARPCRRRPHLLGQGPGHRPVRQRLEAEDGIVQRRLGTPSPAVLHGIRSRATLHWRGVPRPSPDRSAPAARGGGHDELAGTRRDGRSSHRRSASLPGDRPTTIPPGCGRGGRRRAPRPGGEPRMGVRACSPDPSHAAAARADLLSGEPVLRSLLRIRTVHRRIRSAARLLATRWARRVRGAVAPDRT